MGWGSGFGGWRGRPAGRLLGHFQSGGWVSFIPAGTARHRTEEGTESNVAVLPRRLGDSFVAAAYECNVRELHIKTLADHAEPGRVTGGYNRPKVEQLSACVEKDPGCLLGKAEQRKASRKLAAQSANANSAESE